MTIEEAIKIFSNYALVGTLEETGVEVAFHATPKQMCAAIKVVRSALRDQQEAEKNEPLTLDELRKMDGQAVWLNNSPFGCRCFIVNNKFAFRRGIVACGIDMWGKATSLSILAEIGLYRRPPCANSTPAVL